MKFFGSKASGRKRKKKKSSRHLSPFGAVLAALAIAFATYFVIAAYRAERCGGILPNVCAYGVELGGLSQSEAHAALESSLEAEGSGVSVKLRSGGTLEITRADTIAGYDAAAAAKAAWEYGRVGQKVSSLRYALAMLRRTEICPEYSAGIDGAALRAAVAKKAAEINSTLVEGAYSVNGTNLTVIKGASGVMLDEDALFSAVLAAFERGESSAEYLPETAEPAPLSIDDIYSIVCREPRDAYFDSAFNIIPGQDGMSFDLPAAREVYAAAEDGAVISVMLSITPPEITTEELGALLYRDRLAEWTSELTNNEVRSKNIELAAEAVNGTVLLPGDKFSFNETVGQRTAERGYGAAAAYSNGQTVYEIGGGICQVSSSIYYCCLVSDMEVLSRTCHLYTAAYVPPGMDATVSWGGPEFEFRNNSDYPLKILTWRSGDQLCCEFYGTKTDDDYIVMDYEIVSATDYDTVYKEDESIAPGCTKTQTSGITGYKVISYKVRRAADGSLISRDKVDTSVYSKRDRVVLIAPGELYLYDLTLAPPASTKPEPSPDETPEPSPGPSEEPVPETSAEPSPEAPASGADIAIWDN